MSSMALWACINALRKANSAAGCVGVPTGEQYAEARRALWRHLNPKRPWACPACRQELFRTDVLARHLSRCCPDLFPDQVTLPPRPVTFPSCPAHGFDWEQSGINAGVCACSPIWPAVPVVPQERPQCD